MEERIGQEAEPERAKELLTAAYILMGLTYSRSAIDQLVKGLRQMRDSVTYQAILEEGLAEGRGKGLAEGRAEGLAEGRAEEARNLLLLAGRKRLGEPNATTLTTVETLSEVERLEALMLRLFEVETWDELLA
jgi:predicted transposase YdaD